MRRKLSRQNSVKSVPIGNTHTILSLRQSLLNGNLSYMSDQAKVWGNHIFKLSVFVSSTFTDTVIERNILMNEVLPSLREIGKQHGVEVVFVDMRFGVKDKITLNHLTWDVCRRELQRCNNESFGIFFLSLQSEKYGSTFLPRAIRQDIFKRRLELFPEKRGLAQKWYSLDSNAVPPVYLLRNLTQVNDDTFWNEAVVELLIVFDGEEFDTLAGPGVVINRSVTEWEVKCASWMNDDSDDSRILWLHRTFDGGVPMTADKRFKQYSDVLEDPSKEEKYRQMKSWMLSNIPAHKVHSFSEAGYESYEARDPIWQQQLERWKATASTELRKSLDGIIRDKLEWDRDGPGRGLPGEEAFEMLRHCSWAARKVSDFMGRDELKAAAIDIILPGAPAAISLERLALVDASAEVVKSSHSLLTESPYSGVCLCVVGVSGAGKTALMAKVAEEVSLRQWRASKDGEGVGNISQRPVLMRFCGTTPDSSTGLSLVRSLCRQIHFALGHDMRDFESILLMDYNKAVDHFHKLLHENAVILFIDSLDQLSDDHLARSALSFLKNLKPHPLTRVVVSTLPDDEGTGGSFYGCESLLKEAGVPLLIVRAMSTNPAPPLLSSLQLPSPPRALESLGAATAAASSDDGGHSSREATEALGGEALQLIDQLLQRSERCLTPNQLRLLMSRVAVEPTVLYIRLALLVVQKWHSQTAAEDLILAGGVRNLTMQIFAEVEQLSGVHLTRAALGFLTYSVEGISDNEMCDLLSLHVGVMAELNQYFTTDRVPMHVWLRLREAIDGLISEREGGCWGWYHRQLREAAEVRYKDEKQDLHVTMGRYFSNKVDSAEKELRCIIAQHYVLRGPEPESVRAEGCTPRPSESEPDHDLAVWFPTTTINRRRCVEAGHHLLSAGLLTEAVEELCSLTSVKARAACSQMFVLMAQLALLPAEDEQVAHYLRWIRQDASQISLSPECNVLSTCLSQFDDSLARENCLSLLEAMCWQHGSLSEKSHWVRPWVLGTKSGFDILLYKLTGHAQMINSVCWSSDGSLIASGSDDKSVRLWDTDTGCLKRTLEGHTHTVKSVSWSRDCSLLASASYDCTVRVWDPSSGRLRLILEGHTNKVNSVAWSADGARLVSGSDDLTVRVWLVAVGCIEHVLQGHEKEVKSVCWIGDSRRIASASYDTTVRVWDAETGCAVSTIEGHTQKINSVSCSRDGAYIASGSFDRTVRVWNVASDCLALVLTGHGGCIRAVCWSRDCKFIASSSDDMSVRVWDVLSGSLMRTLEGHTTWPSSLCWSPDGTRIVSGAFDKNIRVWDVPPSEVMQCTVRGHSHWVHSVSWSSDGSRIASASEDKSIVIWNASTHRLDRFLRGHEKGVTAICWSGDSTRLVSGSDDKKNIVWDVQSGERLVTLTGHEKEVTSVCWNPAGTCIASASDDMSVRIWDAATGQLLHTLLGHEKGVKSVSWSSCGAWIASGSNDSSIRVWNAESGASERKILGHEKWVKCVAWSNDGKRIASGSFDNTVRIWNAASGSLEQTLVGHSGWVKSVAWGGDDSRIVSGSSDTTLRLWDATTGLLLRSMQGHKDGVSAVCWCVDGARIASGSQDNTVVVWDAVSKYSAP